MDYTDFNKIQSGPNVESGTVFASVILPLQTTKVHVYKKKLYTVYNIYSYYSMFRLSALIKFKHDYCVADVTGQISIITLYDFFLLIAMTSLAF